RGSQRGAVARHHSSDQRWLNLCATPLLDENSELEEILLCFNDISEKKIIESELFDSKSRYEVIFNAVNDGIFLFDHDDFSLIDVNEPIIRMFGYSREEILRMNIGELSDSENGFTAEKVRRYAEKAVEGEIMTAEWLAKDRNNNCFWVYTILKVLKIGRQKVLMSIVRNIDEQKRTQNSLQKSQEHFRALTQNSPDVIMRFDKQQRHLFVNDKIHDLIGIAPEKFINKTHEEMGIFPDHLCRLWEMNIKKVFESGVAHATEFSLPAMGKWIDIEWRLFPEFDEHNRVESVVAVARDVSESKRHETIQNVLIEIANAVNNTRNLDELFLQIQKSLGDVIDTRNCYVALYDEKTDTLTLPFHQDEKDTFKEFPAGKTVTGYVIKTGKAQLVNLDRVEELERTGEIEPIGAPSVSWLGVPLQIAEKIIGVFVVQSYTEDILYTNEDVQLLEFVSDQIALAIERKIDQDKLKNNQLRQRRIIESSPDGLVVIDMDGKILDCNSTFGELLRKATEEVKEKNFFEFVTDEEIIKVQNILNETLKTSYSKNFEFVMRRGDGSRFFTETSFGLIHGDDDKEGSFVIVIKNIDERKAYEDNLKIAKEKAEESDRLKTAFLSNMSHEIRTPMNAIIGFAELLSRLKTSEEEKTEYIKQINFAADTLMKLIDDIIDISKIEAGQLKMNPSLFHLEPLFEELHSMFRKSLERQNKAHIHFVVENHHDIKNVQLHTDDFRLRQVFSNLLSNAIKFTSTGKISFGVKSIKNGKICFFVKDSGVGISEDKQKYIFDRFRQGHESKESFYGGTGLGLAISKNLLTLMKGELKVISAVNKGSEFYFSLPYDGTNLEIPDEKILIDRSPLDWSTKTFLIAEDDTSNYYLLQENLKKYNVNILWAKNGNEAVTLFKENKDKVDIVLMDMQMPELNGYDATRIIKTIAPSVPVIAQTAYALAGERESSLRAGCDDYISKPLMMKELLFMLNKIFDKERIHE
ncbi:MAG: PAS domain S-box protein, partial [Bacteroidota bacterium]